MNDQMTDPKLLVITRTSTHGDFPGQAEFFEAIMRVWESTPNWHKMPAYMRYSIRYQTEKDARIAFGDYMHMDHWADSGGYIQLVVDQLRALHSPHTSLIKHMPPAIDMAQLEEEMRAGTPEDGGHHARAEEE